MVLCNVGIFLINHLQGEVRSPGGADLAGWCWVCHEHPWVLEPGELPGEGVLSSLLQDADARSSSREICK